MIFGRIQDGHIQLDIPLPAAWEGQMVRVETCTPDDSITDLAERLQALHALGPVEFEFGEREQMQLELEQMDQHSRAQMQHILDQLS